jgi:hypothetical protein
MAALIYSFISKPGSVPSFPRFPRLIEKIPINLKILPSDGIILVFKMPGLSWQGIRSAERWRNEQETGKRERDDQSHLFIVPFLPSTFGYRE